MRRQIVTCDICDTENERIKPAQLKMGGTTWNFDVCAACFDKGIPTLRALWAKCVERRKIKVNK